MDPPRIIQLKRKNHLPNLHFLGFQPLIFTEEEELTDALKKLSPEELAKLKSALGTKVVVEPWNEGTKRDKVGGLSLVVVVVVVVVVDVVVVVVAAGGGVFVFLLYLYFFCMILLISML